jgi:FKBP-type peptidyl-prolyl cis-trans isomerase FklB
MVDPKVIARRIVPAFIVVTLVAGLSIAQTPPKADAPPNTPAPLGELKSDKQKLSYGLGLQAGMQVRRTLAQELDIQAFLRGAADAATGGNLAVSEADLNRVMGEFQDKIMKQQLEALKANPKWQAIAGKNKKDGDAYLAANKAKEGVKTLPSGLQYKVIKSGSGPSPGLNDTVVAHYHGTLVDGTVFDSSVERGKPAPFPVNRVVKGWTEALQLMKVGDKWQLVVPPSLAYGELGNESIGPNSTLIFDVELLEVKKEPAAK